MNNQVDDMVTKGVVLPDIPVKGKGEVGNGSVEGTRGKGFGMERLPEGFRHQVVDTEPGILRNIWRVVEYPWCVEAT